MQPSTLFLLSHQMQCIHRLQSYNIYPSPSKHIAVNLPLLFSTTLTFSLYKESDGANWPRLILNLGTQPMSIYSLLHRFNHSHNIRRVNNAVTVHVGLLVTIRHFFDDGHDIRGVYRAITIYICRIES